MTDQRRPSPKARAWYQRRALIYPLLALAGYVAWCAVIFFKQDGMIFPRNMAKPIRADAGVPRGVERVVITAADGSSVEGWLFKSADPGPKPLYVFMHGNAELIDDCISHADGFLQLGVHVFLPEYRGYGRAGGAPSQAAITDDLVRFVEMLAARPEIDRTRIIYHGRSLGGGVAAALTAVRPPAALVLESTFTSVASFAGRYWVPEFLCRHPFHNDDVVAQFKGPILIFHGARDDIVPVEHGRRLHALAPGSTYVEEPDGNHVDFPPDTERYLKHIREFLTGAGILSDAPATARPAAGSHDRRAATRGAGAAS